MALVNLIQVVFALFWILLFPASRAFNVAIEIRNTVYNAETTVGYTKTIILRQLAIAEGNR
jgi:hypothetical protein